MNAGQRIPFYALIEARAGDGLKVVAKGSPRAAARSILRLSSPVASALDPANITTMERGPR